MRDHQIEALEFMVDDNDLPIVLHALAEMCRIPRANA